MTVLVINVGETIYGNQSLPLIEKLCDYNNVNLFVLDKNIPQNTYNLHPSWLKLFCFDLIKDDFIISWDLDLLPLKLYKFDTYFDTSSWNLSYDPAFSNLNFTFNGKFKYNCGLMGIPSYFADRIKKLYIDKGKNSNYPSYEQYHINDMIYDENININLINSNLNFLYDGNELFSENILNLHYTGKIKSNEHRIELIDKHYKKYKENFNI
jgi:hypothetical protein